MLGLTPHPLQQPLTVRVANGQGPSGYPFCEIAGTFGTYECEIVVTNDQDQHSGSLRLPVPSPTTTYGGLEEAYVEG